MQLSINATKGFEHHLELDRTLAPLRERGVLVIASGNVAGLAGAAVGDSTDVLVTATPTGRCR
ncbi:hypothetical protein [Geodermatophilus sp. URMC 64]